MNSDTDKPTTSQAENVYEKPRKRGCIGHCLKFWWAYLIVFVIAVVLVVCLVLFVAVPKIAQKKVNEASLTIQGISVRNTRAETYTMAINSTITTDGSVKATIEGFTGQMYLEDLEPHTTFATVDFPETSGDALQIVNVTQNSNITDMEAFTVFNTWLLLNDTLRVTVTGNTHIRVHGLSKSYPVTFTKTVTLDGLRNFNGTQVTQSTISALADSNGDNFKGYVTIPNYSIFVIEIGNTSFHNFLQGEDIGTVYIDDMTLYPGNNNFSMRANITQVPVLDVMTEQPYCSNGGIVPFQLLGKTVVNHGDPLPYFADALATSNQTIEINIGDDLKEAFNYTAKCASTKARFLL